MVSPPSRSQLTNRRNDGIRIPRLFAVLLFILSLSVYITITNQVRVIGVDFDGKTTINWESLIHSALLNNNNEKHVERYDNNNGNDGIGDDSDDGSDGNDTQFENKDDGKDDDNDENEDDGYLEGKQTEFAESDVSVRPITGRQRMNVLILYPDDWRHDSLGSEKPYVKTPFLDQLAKEGIRFTHNAATTSVCWMSRATLWMGQYSSRHRSYKLKCPRFSSPANWDHSWVRMLQKAGYFIGHVGKWQYHSKEGIAKLFDWSRHFEQRHWEHLSDGRVVHASDLAKDHALEFLKERPKDKPFALSIAFYPPKPVGNGRAPGHQWSPTNETRKLYDNVTIPEPESKESFKKLPNFLQKGPARGRFGQRYPTSEHFQASMKNYYALITGVDQACKEVVDKLKEEGLYNNTMIIFTTDNGMFHGAHGLAGKWYPYQESIRVPLIIYDPRMPAEKVGILDDSFTLNIDLAETILGAAGVKPDDLMQGRDISDLYLPNKKDEYHSTPSAKSEAWREEFFYEFPSPEEIYIPSSTALVRKEWKFIYWPEHNREQLFNLKDDPLELNDLYDTKDDKVKAVMISMRERHDELKGELHDTSYTNDTEACNRFLVD